MEKIARSLASGTALEWNDLLQEVIVRTLAGSRHCPRNVPLVAYLVNAMRSVISEERTAVKRRPPSVSLSATGTDGAAAHDVPSSEINAEDRLLADADYYTLLAKAEAQLSQDEDAQMVFLADIEGLSAQEIREMQNWDEREYATIRRRLRRTLDQAIRRGDLA